MPDAAAQPADKILVIACGALAREIIALKRAYGWDHMQLLALDAKLHNQPHLIPPRLQACIRANAESFARIFVAYADCGTAGAIDRVLEEEAVERLPGAHCYQFFAGAERFEELSQQEPGTFYLTDFLARNFQRLVVRPLKMDQYPELKHQYFAHYKRLVYLSQAADARLQEAARAAAHYLGLLYEHQHCGYGELETSLQLHIESGRNLKSGHRINSGHLIKSGQLTQSGHRQHGHENPHLLA